ncbi:hypothetical protein [Dactylosporangium salmoneum]|uniref:hypothetical protein n=1 Tax=Dactylosporangium salmoneum TaxID=53361 RepID=UPI0031D7E261
MQLNEAVQQRQHHHRQAGGATCVVCGERHPCAEWRRARAVVLVLVRRAFAAARASEPF